MGRPSPRSRSRQLGISLGNPSPLTITAEVIDGDWGGEGGAGGESGGAGGDAGGDGEVGGSGDGASTVKLSESL